MDASDAFDKAVKHLFRHLHDPSALSRNPLLQHIFNDPSVEDAGPSRNTAAVVRIHELVREGAEYFRDLDLRSGKRQRGLRHYAIITRQCLEQRPIRDVAAELRISYHHCYRERASACRRMAQFICAHDQPTGLEYLAGIDEFGFSLERARREVARGEIEAALRGYDALIRAAPSAEQKIEALCLKTHAALTGANVKEAEAAFSAAKVTLAEQVHDTTPSDAVLSQVWIEVTGGKFARHRGETGDAMKLAQRAIAALEPLQTGGSARVRNLYADSLCDLAAALWRVGSRERAYACVVKAEGLRLFPTSSQLRSCVELALWKYRSRLLLSAQAWRPGWERLRGLTTTFEVAYASGWLEQAIAALATVAEAAALAGRKKEALHAAKLAVSLARQQANESLKIIVPIDIAALLMPTECWEEGLALFSEVKQPHPSDAFCRAQASYVLTVRALRQRRLQDAWRLGIENDSYTGFTELTLKKRTVAAMAAHDLGWSSKARAILEELIPEAESFGSAPVLRDAYNVAASVLSGNTRFRNKASELSALLTT